MLLRHAKSDWPEDVPDQERPLAERGRRDAPAVGRWLREAGCRPDYVVCSTALRTRQTWDLAKGEIAADPPVVFEPRVYGATVAELVDVIAGVPADAATVLVIGHNPGLEILALALAGQAPGAANDHLREKFPTAAVAVFSWSGRWDQRNTSADPKWSKVSACMGRILAVGVSGLSMACPRWEPGRLVRCRRHGKL